jgi:FtsP/CotA-like multicopper oxidase with cupredoxin domain
MWQASLLPDSYDIASMGYVDYGGGPRSSGHNHGSGSRVADLVETAVGPADVTETFTVRTSGAKITVNGSTPGPTLRAVAGDLVEVTLVNVDVTDGATLHWHGVDVPNAMDGVAGVTQNAVAPGESFVYRFVVPDAGTYWYHSHQVSHEQVRRGLLGAIVVGARGTDTSGDVVAVLHQYGADATVNGSTEIEVFPLPVGETVRVRVVNADNALSTVWVTGAAFRVLAVDGADLIAPTSLEGVGVAVPGAGRVDLEIVVPPGGARVEFAGTAALALGRDPAVESIPPKQLLDLLDYGSAGDPGLDASHPDRVFDYSIGRRLGFLDGRPGRWWTINGHLFPDVPMFSVEEGDVVVFRIDNHSGEPHPMHLHGHHALVLSRNGTPATGSPWWVDTLEVNPGESFEIAFLADNPGIWMDHCHNLPHASEGLVAHVMYAGVTSSFRVGGSVHNHPE